MKAGYLKGKSGIYKIINTTNGKCYVGSAVNLPGRWASHRKNLRSKKHNPKLQNAWNKYGEDAFEFLVIEFVDDKTKLIEREQYWIDTLDVVKKGYNILPTAGSMLGYKASEESRKLQSRIRTGRKYSLETRAKQSASLKGRIITPESLEKSKNTRAQNNILRKEGLLPPHKNKGVIRSDEYKVRLSATKSGVKQTPEQIEAARLGKARAKALREQAYIDRGEPIPVKVKKEKPALKIKDKSIPHPFTGRKLSPEVIAKREETKRLKREKAIAEGTYVPWKPTPETIAKCKATKESKKEAGIQAGTYIPISKSEETKIRMREAALLRWERERQMKEAAD